MVHEMRAVTQTPAWAKAHPNESPLLPYDTVRGAFWEGGPLYPGARIEKKNHVQICMPDATAGHHSLPLFICQITGIALGLAFLMALLCLMLLCPHGNPSRTFWPSKLATYLCVTGFQTGFHPLQHGLIAKVQVPIQKLFRLCAKHAVHRMSSSEN
jgi:hypothetical protein